jgi:5-methylthioadenosine/S-adenosylhomocysteine deaminase
MASNASSVLIRDGIVLPMNGTRTVHDPGSVLILDGVIAAIGPSHEVARHPAAATVQAVDASMHAVIPGLHNGHLHSGLLRGTAESMALWEWLENHVDPAHRALTPEIARAASYMAYTEALRGGTTSVLDMWRFMEGSAEAADDVGIRATLAPYCADRYDYFESIESNRRLLESHLVAADGRVRSWVGLEHIFYCSPEMFRSAAALAEEFGTGIHTHSSESIWEVEECLRQFGRRPIEEMYQRGILGPSTVIAHAVWLDDREVEVLAQTSTAMTHCPCSNMKLSSGAARIGHYRARGVVCALGTDGEKENNNLDMLEEMKFASLLQKVSTLDPTTGDPWDVLDMATRSGAQALGLADVTGSLEPGKDADVVTVDLRALHFVPVLHGQDLNVAAHLVFTASSHDVRDVWVKGRRLVADGVVVSVDVVAIAAEAQAAAEDLFARRRALTGRTPSPATDMNKNSP